MKNIAIFGSTGSIGTQALDIIKLHKDRYKAHILVGGKNITLLAEQANAFQPQMVICSDAQDYDKLKALVLPSIEVAAGRKAILEAAEMPVDIHLAAITGAAGLEPVFNAVKQGITIALANKEALVCAGALLMDAVKKYNSKIIPVDSEHSAIFQCLEDNYHKCLDHIILTGSGGPFRQTPIDALKHISVAQAISHPNWSMGKKISVDSATMMNKSLEFIEACHLFDVTPAQIKVLIHPGSIMHSAVAYKDGSIIAHLGVPDMRVPIGMAFSLPERLQSNVNILDLAQLGQLSFEAPDYQRFPALQLVKEVVTQGSYASIAFNAANEEAVEAFLNEQIAFTQIVPLVQNILENISAVVISSIADVMAFDSHIRTQTKSLIKAGKIDVG